MRFFVAPDQITNQTIRVTGMDAAHMFASLRLKAGDIITVCDGSGKDYACEITALNKNSADLAIINTYRSSTEPNIKVTLFQAMPKYGKMELVIEKCVELGVYEIVPLITRYTQVKINEKTDVKTERFRKISESAAKQCNRAFVPQVRGALRLENALAEMKNFDIAIAAYENETQTKMKHLTKDFCGRSAALIIGPEGGFSEDEAACFAENRIRTVSLGKRILRTETAGFTCLTIFFNETGEF